MSAVAVSAQLCGLWSSPPAATVEMTEPQQLLSVACHCRCRCGRHPNRRITSSLCNLGVGPGCCARNAEGGAPDVGATTCICHICLTDGPAPQPNPREKEKLRDAEDSVAQGALPPQVVFRSTGSSMLVLVGSDVACALHTIHAVTDGLQDQCRVQDDQEQGKERH